MKGLIYIYILRFSSTFSSFLPFFLFRSRSATPTNAHRTIRTCLRFLMARSTLGLPACGHGKATEEGWKEGGREDEAKTHAYISPSPYSYTYRGYDVYTPHRSIVYHDYNHGPDTSVTSSWSRKAQELQVRCNGKGRRGGGKEGGAGGGALNGVSTRSLARRLVFTPFCCFFPLLPALPEQAEGDAWLQGRPHRQK